jgi:hypothetical protein
MSFSNELNDALVDTVTILTALPDSDRVSIENALGCRLMTVSKEDPFAPEGSGDMSYYEGTMSHRLFVTADLRINSVSKKAFLSLRAGPRVDLTRSSARIPASWAWCPVSIRPGVPRADYYHVNFVRVALRFDEKTEALALVSIDWFERQPRTVPPR